MHATQRKPCKPERKTSTSWELLYNEDKHWKLKSFDCIKIETENSNLAAKTTEDWEAWLYGAQPCRFVKNTITIQLTWTSRAMEVVKIFLYSQRFTWNSPPMYVHHFQLLPSRSPQCWHVYVQHRIYSKCLFPAHMDKPQNEWGHFQGNTLWERRKRFTLCHNPQWWQVIPSHSVQVTCCSWQIVLTTLTREGEW